MPKLYIKTNIIHHGSKTTHNINHSNKNLQDKSIPFNRKKNLTDNINLSGPPDTDTKHTKNQVFNLHDPLDTIPL